jgi:hemerythrin-like metal-binding protein
MDTNTFKHYVLGIPEIDAQHWRIFESLNSISLAIENDDAAANKSFTHSFANALYYHNQYEGSLMALSGYPHIDRHLSWHFENPNKLFKRAKDRSEGLTMLYDVQRITNLLAQHIDEEDRQFVPYALLFLENGGIVTVKD